MPWEKKKKPTEAKAAPKGDEAVSTVGALQHFIVKDNLDNNSEKDGWKYVASWGKTYGSQTNILHWSDKHSMLYLGLDSGAIHRYYCQKEKNLKVFQELPTILVHNV